MTIGFLEWSRWQFLIGQEVLDQLKGSLGSKSWDLVTRASHGHEGQPIVVNRPSAHLKKINQIPSIPS